MESRNRAARLVKFGNFELDVNLRQLKRRNRLVKLQDLPFRLLTNLVERPGEIISREELRSPLWGDTVVEFDEGLHTAFCKLREALGDSAAHPRFVATTPRRGYSFIGTIAVDDAVEPENQIASFAPVI